MYQKKQIDLLQEERVAREKEVKIHEDKMHQLNLQVKEFEVRRRIFSLREITANSFSNGTRNARR